MSLTANTEEVLGFNKSVSTPYEDRSISSGSYISNKRETSPSNYHISYLIFPAITSFKHIRNCRLEIKAQKNREKSQGLDEQVDCRYPRILITKLAFLEKVTELEQEWNTHKKKVPAVSFRNLQILSLTS